MVLLVLRVLPLAPVSDPVKGSAPIELDQRRHKIGVGDGIAERGDGMLQLLGALLMGIGSHERPSQTFVITAPIESLPRVLDE
jgi:hypothetical protein